MEHVSHEFEPVWNKDSRVLVLGTFPSVKSRQQKFYYGHPQNRFWKVTAALLERGVPERIEEKKKLLLEGHIAVWDVIDSCDIEGSSDSSIRNVKANDIGGLLGRTSIQAVFANGDKAYQLYLKYCREQAGDGYYKASLHQSGQCGLVTGKADGSLASDGTFSADRIRI